MASNRTKRNFYLIVTILGIIGLIAILIIESQGPDVNNWFFYTAMSAIFVGAIYFNRFRKAANDDAKKREQYDS